jgi:hypothetical protein
VNAVRATRITITRSRPFTFGEWSHAGPVAKRGAELRARPVREATLGPW